MKYKDYILTVEQTVKIINHVPVEASCEETAKARFEHWLDNARYGWYDETSWGEAHYYQCVKAGPQNAHFEIIAVEREEDSE